MKLSLNRRQIVTAVIVVAVVLIALMLGRGSREGDQQEKLDDPAAQACTDFAAGYPKARSTTARLALADKVSKSVAGTDNDEIADRVRAIGDSANDTTAAWQRDADALARACQDAGWSGA